MERERQAVCIAPFALFLPPILCNTHPHIHKEMLAATKKIYPYNGGLKSSSVLSLICLLFNYSFAWKGHSCK